MDNINILNKIECCGCRSCEQSCKKSCIDMVMDLEGFLTPQVDETQCNSCGLCVSACPVLSNKNIKDVEPVVYAAKNKDLDILKDSTSGGIFDVFAREILKQGGSVFGCAWSEELIAEHIEVREVAELYRLHGSKYVQSDTKHTYSEVKQRLIDGKLVLYSGTSCQIAGLKSYLRNDYENLITIDIICHGVPSPLFFEKYKKWLAKKMGSKVIDYNFRSKEKNAWGLTYKAKTKTKTKFLSAYLDPYYKAFLEGATYRECCYKCKYANKNKPSDITLGDYWGIEKKHPEFFDDRGVSVVIINTAQGDRLWNTVKHSVESIESRYSYASEENGNLINPSNRDDRRNSVYCDIIELDVDVVFEKRLNVGIQLSKRIKSAVPYQLKRRLKGLR